MGRGAMREGTGTATREARPLQLNISVHPQHPEQPSFIARLSQTTHVGIISFYVSECVSLVRFKGLSRPIESRLVFGCGFRLMKRPQLEGHFEAYRDDTWLAF
jgi:hypothetical protein